ncbi:collagen-like protein [Bradyrhizobium sp. 153]|uniref:collagen-like protein n=1 Tax=Bradyrhizobium sp. 153 TaxID=2782627 RepID=UPI001FFA3E6B|nr:collagen-like protein [Bradyrhizobium sp. 153]MCK1668661.1 collagen-like protein [Bradyrhizobium sp. 153]
MSLGSNGDLYIDRDNGDYYAKVEGAWVFQGNLRGPQGATGAQGVQGPQGLPGAPGAVVITADLLFGEGPPDDADGVDSQVYVDETTSDVYKKTAGHWELQTNIRGQNGANVLTGTSDPAPELGNDGDSFINTVTGAAFAKSAGVWTATGGNLKGPKGDKGDTGSVGPAGAQGATGPKGDKGDTGAAGPAGDIGPAGAQGAMGPKGDKGDKGDTGAAGPAGDIGPAGADGARGSLWYENAGPPGNISGQAPNDVYLNTTNGEVYRRDATVWTLVGSIKGPQGPSGADGLNGTDGADGARGSLWYENTGAPGVITGQAQNDVYLNTTTGDVYRRGASAWTLVGNIRGPQGPAGADGAPGDTGPKGDTGARGSLWYNGTGAPGTIAGQADGDEYLDAATGDVYARSAGAWSKVGNIKGPAGTGGGGGAGGGGMARNTWTFDAVTTDSDPGAGKFRLNSTFTIEKYSVVLYVSTTDKDGNNVASVLDGLRAGDAFATQLVTLYFSTPTVFTKRVTGRVTAVVASGAYRKITLDVLYRDDSATASFASGDNITFQFDPVSRYMDPPPFGLNVSDSSIYSVPGFIPMRSKTLSLASNRAYVVPVRITRPTRITGFRMSVNTAGTAGNARFMIYKLGQRTADGLSDSGDLVTSSSALSNAFGSTGGKSGTLAATVLAPGYYWFVMAVAALTGAPVLNALSGFWADGNYLALPGASFQAVDYLYFPGDLTAAPATLSGLPTAQTSTLLTSSFGDVCTVPFVGLMDPHF